MDRQIVYPGAIPLETDLLNTNKNVMVAFGKLAAAVLGTSTVVNGLSVVANNPAALNVIVNPGEIYSLQNLDGTAYSSLAADTTHQIMKQGILLDAVTLATPAPTTAGQSINYLIQAAYQDSDSGNVALPYYNASNPSQAYSGPNNSGTAQPTVRKGTVVVTAKAGVAANTSSQATPIPDSGYVGLYVVTVANGQSSVTSSNISVLTTAPFINSSLLGLNPAFAVSPTVPTPAAGDTSKKVANMAALSEAVQNSGVPYVVDAGTANAYVATYSPAVTSLTDGKVYGFKAANANTGASTLNINGIGAKPILGSDYAALTGSEIISSAIVEVTWNASLNSGSGAFVITNIGTGYPKFLTSPTGDNSNKGATTGFVVNALNNNVLGLGQTWKDKTAAYATANTNYTNLTGRPIAIRCGIFNGAAIQLKINGNIMFTQNNITVFLFFILLPGEYWSHNAQGVTRCEELS